MNDTRPTSPVRTHHELMRLQLELELLVREPKKPRKDCRKDTPDTDAPSKKERKAAAKDPTFRKTMKLIEDYEKNLEEYRGRPSMVVDPMRVFAEIFLQPRSENDAVADVLHRGLLALRDSEIQSPILGWYLQLALTDHLVVEDKLDTVYGYEE